MIIQKPVSSERYTLAYAPIEDSDQSVHPHRVIRDFKRRSMGNQRSIRLSGGKTLIRLRVSCADQEGAAVWTPPLLVNHKGIGILSNTGPDPLEKSQSYQVSIQCWATIGPPAKRHLNGVLLAG